MDNQIIFHVTDTGTGIPAEKLPKIFDRFMMANDNVAGTGLGLSISKIIAEKLGGKNLGKLQTGERDDIYIHHPLYICQWRSKKRKSYFHTLHKQQRIYT